jgi:hypothetical protein
MKGRIGNLNRSDQALLGDAKGLYDPIDGEIPMKP